MLTATEVKTNNIPYELFSRWLTILDTVSYLEKTFGITVSDKEMLLTAMSDFELDEADILKENSRFIKDYWRKSYEDND